MMNKGEICAYLRVMCNVAEVQRHRNCYVKTKADRKPSALNRVNFFDNML